MRGCALVKETKTVGRYRVLAIAEVLAQLEQARAEAKALVLDSMAEVCGLAMNSCFAVIKRVISCVGGPVVWPATTQYKSPSW